MWQAVAKWCGSYGMLSGGVRPVIFGPQFLGTWGCEYVKNSEIHQEFTELVVSFVATKKKLYQGDLIWVDTSVGFRTRCKDDTGLVYTFFFGAWGVL